MSKLSAGKLERVRVADAQIRVATVYGSLLERDLERRGLSSHTVGRYSARARRFRLCRRDPDHVPLRLGTDPLASAAEHGPLEKLICRSYFRAVLP